ncbi:MAG TPA: MlaD family protein [Bradyrhizobium sp.]|uniref:MlaD family protein n=1 Tax=Bradyrhizobium sp. TaxID=376 RepID=UPI002B593DF9|nr:MlaD family protein [Bradyrhizobium sp.]HLZ03955.1 MlaD family protein [Bradyrhizobium sp.]
MRATNLVVGTTTLAIIGAALGGLLIFERVHGLRNQSPLRIVFNGSASGLRKGGTVTFDGVPAGRIRSIKLESPTKIVALVMLDNAAPIRKDTAIGIEFQGLTGVADIALVGGAPSAPPAPLDKDGVPVLTADWSEQQSITDTLHYVDHLLIDNRETIKSGMRSFETYTAELKDKGEAIDGIMSKTEDAFAGFDNTMAKINDAVPGFADGKAQELFEKLKSFSELADTYRQKSATFMEEGHRMLADVSDGANNFTRKINPSALAAPPPRRPTARRRQ